MIRPTIPVDLDGKGFVTANEKWLITFGGAEVTFSGWEPKTTCDPDQAHCDPRGRLGYDPLKPGRIAAGTINQTYHVTNNSGIKSLDNQGSDGIVEIPYTGWEQHCRAESRVYGPTYIVGCLDGNCDSYRVTRNRDADPESAVPAVSDGTIFVEVEYRPGNPYLADPGYYSEGGYVVVYAYLEVPYWHFIDRFPFGTGVIEGIQMMRVYLFYGRAPLCGLSYPTFVVENQITDDCFHPFDVDGLFSLDSDSDDDDGTINYRYATGGRGGVATVTLKCFALGVSSGDGDGLEMNSCDEDSSGSSESGSDSESGSSDSGSSSGSIIDPDPPSGSGGSDSGGDTIPIGGSGSDDDDEEDRQRTTCPSLAEITEHCPTNLTVTVSGVEGEACEDCNETRGYERDGAGWSYSDPFGVFGDGLSCEVIDGLAYWVLTWGCGSFGAAAFIFRKPITESSCSVQGTYTLMSANNIDCDEVPDLTATVG